MNSIERSLRLAGVAMVALGMFGCGSSLNGPGPGTGGGPGGGNGTGGAAGVGTDGGNVDGPVGDAPLVCPQPVSTLCSISTCKTTWAEVLATPPVCVLFNTTETRSTCGDYYLDVFARSRVGDRELLRQVDWPVGGTIFRRGSTAGRRGKPLHRGPSGRYRALPVFVPGRRRPLPPGRGRRWRASRRDGRRRSRKLWLTRSKAATGMTRRRESAGRRLASRRPRRSRST